MGLHVREDHLATSGTVGLTGLGESSLAPGEGQGRGFEHAHSRNTAYPKGYLIQRDILRAASASRRTRAAFQRVEAQDRADRPVDAATPDRADTPVEDATHEAATESNTKPTLSPAAVRYNEALIQHTATRQYESSVLPGRQLGLHLAPPPFTPLQQRQSRYDGQLEADDVTQRPLVQITESEPPAHMARELRVAQAERRPARVAYGNVPLTGHGVTLMPGYQLLENLGAEHLVPRGGELPPLPARTRPARSLAEICVCDEYGRFLHFLKPDGSAATSGDLKRDAECWELAFAEDYRWLSAHSHDHTCATTCVKKMKKATEVDKKKAIARNKATPAGSGSCT